MLHEHIQGRIFVKGIAENMDLYKNGNIAALSEIYQEYEWLCRTSHESYFQGKQYSFPDGRQGPL